METKDKRVKREIANSNERRRMQSINAGFQNLKRYLPVNDGEKLSKAAILQHASEFIQQIEREKVILYKQNTLLRGILMEVKGGTHISKALGTLDLDALPSIAIHTNMNTATTTTTTTTTSPITTTTNSNDIFLSDKEVIKNGNKRVKNGNKNGNNCNNNNNNNNFNNNPNSANPNNNCNTDCKTSDRVPSPKNGLVPTGVAKAAIALPLEVPYQHHHELHPEGPHLQNETDPTPKGQNLDTICMVIKEIEGDRVFNK